MYTEGKFDMHASDSSPFAGIAQAYSDVFQRLKTNRVEACAEIATELTAQLGAEGAGLLTYLIPELDEFLAESSVSDASDATKNEALQERWK